MLWFSRVRDSCRNKISFRRTSPSSALLRSNIPQTALVATLDTNDFIVGVQSSNDLAVCGLFERTRRSTVRLTIISSHYFRNNQFPRDNIDGTPSIGIHKEGQCRRDTQYMPSGLVCFGINNRDFSNFKKKVIRKRNNHVRPGLDLFSWILFQN
jgi:hypothetical protein